MDEDPTRKLPSSFQGEDALIRAAFRQEAGSGSDRPARPRLPEQIGPYKIIRRIGSGGMGVVYEAEQAEPVRRIALKVTRAPTGDSPYHLRLFQREIQVLARLRHPSIAQIYEAGHTEDGQQYYFAMELIEGQHLVEYCDMNNLPLRNRLTLFARVCNAIQYAHQRGVIHRDLKPANILVDDEGVPHILDFGLARFIDPEMNVTRSLLEGRALVGTLPYMSPEQTRADTSDIDIRTDVYSLGVILYEMLTGRYPYQVFGPLVEALRAIAEMEPAPPSSIRHQINNEVETIVLRALAKDRDRRYQSAEALGQDVQRYLEGEPIDAKRDSALYVIRKLALRHSYAAAVVAMLVVAMIGFGAISFYFYRGERRSVDELAQLNQATTEKNKELEVLVVDSQEFVRRQALGWFLLEWHANRLDQARAIRNQVQQGFPERTAMEFLLDETYTPEKLRADLPAEEAPVAQFVIGERNLKSGNKAEAITAFEQCLALSDSGWLATAAKARLQQLRPENARVSLDGMK